SALTATVRVGPEPHEFYTLQKSHFGHGASEVAVVPRNGEILNRVFPRDRRIVRLIAVLRNESLRRRGLRYSQSKSRAIGDGKAIRRVMHAHDNVASCRHEDACVHRTIIFVRQSRQITKLIAAPDRLASR